MAQDIVDTQIEMEIEQEKERFHLLAGRNKTGSPDIDIDEFDDGTDQRFYCLITGANSGLGLALCCRFLAQFLLTRPATHHLTLIFTTRNSSKSLQTTNCILSSLRQGFPRAPTERFTLAPAFVDLTDLLSVNALITHIQREYPKLDWVYCNAGMLTTAGGGGVNYLRAVLDIVTSPVKALTTPEYKLQTKGEIVLQGPKPRGGKRSISNESNAEGAQGGMCEPDGLGLIWAANVFGHYLIIHGLLSLLTRGGVRKGERARVIWTSSLDGHSRSLDVHDIQCVRGKELYESSKRLTDVLALTWPDAVAESFVQGKEVDRQRLPRFYLTHPAICATNIAGQHPLMWYIMLLMFYVVRFVCGSPWHPITAWKGNAANMWVGTEKEEVLEKKGKAKWGSACGRLGKEMVRETEIEGVSGRQLGEDMKKVGEQCWVRMEEVRKEWEERLGLLIE